jgi:hypothetical protein
MQQMKYQRRWRLNWDMNIRENTPLYICTGQFELEVIYCSMPGVVCRAYSLALNLHLQHMTPNPTRNRTNKHIRRKIMMKFGKHTEFLQDFYQQNLMGPSTVRILDELCGRLNLSPDMRISDLGCGTGLTSIYLAKEYGAQVFATDLWVSATDNYERFKQFGLEDKIIPIHADASQPQATTDLTGDWGTIPESGASRGLARLR